MMDPGPPGIPIREFPGIPGNSAPPDSRSGIPGNFTTVAIDSEISSFLREMKLLTHISWLEIQSLDIAPAFYLYCHPSRLPADSLATKFQDPGLQHVSSPRSHVLRTCASTCPRLPVSCAVHAYRAHLDTVTHTAYSFCLTNVNCQAHACATFA